MNRIILLFSVFVISVSCAGCAAARSDSMGTMESDQALNQILPVLTEPEWTSEWAAIVQADARLNETCRNLREWKTVVKSGRKRGYTSQDTERVGQLLFQFAVRRDMLWSKIAKYRNADVLQKDDLNTGRSLITAFASASILSKYSGQLVSEFVSDRALVAKLNEGFYTYSIEKGTFDEIFYSVTSPDNMNQLQRVADILAKDAKRKGSGVSLALASDQTCRSLYEMSVAAHRASLNTSARILAEKSLLIPRLENLLRQNSMAGSVRDRGAKVSKDLYLFQGWFFNSVSDIKSPGTPSIDFNPRQVAFIKSRLQPGDLIFTYTAGYMSNVFLPGKFKHGIVYVGLPQVRRAAGMGEGSADWLPAERRKSVMQDIAYGLLPTGYDADVIEAVAEGVIFNSFDYLLKTHVNRLVVLRPRVSASERSKFLVKVFSLRGSMYDFDFDFEDTTYQCCTEVIYRALDGKAGIDFSLVSRMGVKTLSADDIITHHFATDARLFDVVVYAEENPESPIHGARVLAGEDAEKRLSAVMTGKAE